MSAEFFIWMVVGGLLGTIVGNVLGFGLTYWLIYRHWR